MTQKHLELCWFFFSFFAGPAHMMAQTVLHVTHEGKWVHKPAVCVLPCSMPDWFKAHFFDKLVGNSCWWSSDRNTLAVITSDRFLWEAFGGWPHRKHSASRCHACFCLSNTFSHMPAVLSSRDTCKEGHSVFLDCCTVKNDAALT